LNNNKQSIKIINSKSEYFPNFKEIFEYKDLLEEKYYNFKGLNLTIEALDGLIKHNGPIYNTDRFNKILGLNTFKNKINFKKYPYLESQISSISDDIAYNNHDVEDGIRANLFSLHKILEIPFFNRLFIKHKKI